MTECVTRLLQELASVIGIAFGPEVRDQLVAAHALPAGGGQEGKKRKSLALHGGAGERHTVFLDRQPAESPQFQHHKPSDRFLTWPLRRGSNLAPAVPRRESRQRAK